jgi:hypothetical protein
MAVAKRGRDSAVVACERPYALSSVAPSSGSHTHGARVTARGNGGSARSEPERARPLPYELSGLAATRPDVLRALSRLFWERLRQRAARASRA